MNQRLHGAELNKRGGGWQSQRPEWINDQIPGQECHLHETSDFPVSDRNRPGISRMMPTMVPAKRALPEGCQKTSTFPHRKLARLRKQTPVTSIRNSCEPGENVGQFKPAQGDELVPRSVPADQFHLRARAIQPVGEEAKQGVIRSGIHRRGSNANAQFIAHGPEDFVGGGAGLEFDAQEQAVRGDAEKPADGHVSVHASGAFARSTAGMWRETGYIILMKVENGELSCRFGATENSVGAKGHGFREVNHV
jgi:hypothetical protein